MVKLAVLLNPFTHLKYLHGCHKIANPRNIISSPHIYIISMGACVKSSVQRNGRNFNNLKTTRDWLCNISMRSGCANDERKWQTHRADAESAPGRVVHRSIKMDIISLVVYIQGNFAKGIFANVHSNTKRAKPFNFLCVSLWHLFEVVLRELHHQNVPYIPS